MGRVGKPEIVTQERIIKMFSEQLGYEYLGDWTDHTNNSHIEREYLTKFLKKQGYSDTLIKKAIDKLENASRIGGNKDLYKANKDVYQLLRYAVKVKEDVGDNNQSVHLIDWHNPQNNHFAIAEEVTIHGRNTKRPDLVIYINGIAVAVIELKKSTVDVSKGIRQNLLNQEPNYIPEFFTTMQLVMAGNDTQGLKYGAIETPELHYLQWKEDGGIGENKLDNHLFLMCEQSRLLDLIYNFVIFDAGIKKLPRQNQYFAIQSAKQYIDKRQGGIIWHTQGSGKSLTMVWLAKWIRENKQDSRVLLITDRKELDEQIERVFGDTGESVYRTTSGQDLLEVLDKTQEKIICSLVHKFGGGNSDELSDNDMKNLIDEIKKKQRDGLSAKGDIYVFIDECHRTQSGKLHQAMKEFLPGALFIGFTGTPLLKNDKQTSLEVFGEYIHTYKWDEAVEDGVILDLQYEARDIDQNVTSPDKIDQWFDAKTKGLNDYAREKLKDRWGTLKKLYSSKTRLDEIVKDIFVDMETKPGLASQKGNAMLVAGSIYEACKYYELFTKAPTLNLKGQCAVVTSCEPQKADEKDEYAGEGETEKLLKYNTYKNMLMDYFGVEEQEALGRVKEFETQVKKQFVKEPSKMRLLIVVDKLLTGFDAPPATYLYIDKKMQDHGLFQAICRVNRLAGEDKDYGHIIDYKDLFKSLESAITDYTSDAFDGFEREDVDGLLKNRLEKAKQKLDDTREATKALCEDVKPPKGTNEYIAYFCAEDTGNIEQLQGNEQRRLALYKQGGSFLRAYAELANEMSEAGYSADEIKEIKDDARHYESVIIEVKMASGDYIELKAYEPHMRWLIDNFIKAGDSETISEFDDMSLIELIVEKGDDAIRELPKGIRNNEDAVAETINNNIRSVIIEKQPTNTVYYAEMSELLDAIIQQRKQEAISYKEYLEKVKELSKKVVNPASNSNYPKDIDNLARMALYDNLEKNEELAMKLDKAIRDEILDGWRGHNLKKRAVKIAIKRNLENTDFNVDEIFDLVVQQNDY